MERVASTGGYSMCLAAGSWLAPEPTSSDSDVVWGLQLPPTGGMNNVNSHPSELKRFGRKSEGNRKISSTLLLPHRFSSRGCGIIAQFLLPQSDEWKRQLSHSAQNITTFYSCSCALLITIQGSVVLVQKVIHHIQSPERQKQMRNDDLNPMLQSECSRNKRANTRAGKGVPGNNQGSIVVDNPDSPLNIKRWCSISSRSILYAECQLSVRPCALSYTRAN